MAISKAHGCAIFAQYSFAGQLPACVGRVRAERNGRWGCPVNVKGRNQRPVARASLRFIKHVIIYRLLYCMLAERRRESSRAWFRACNYIIIIAWPTAHQAWL